MEIGVGILPRAAVTLAVAGNVDGVVERSEAGRDNVENSTL